MESELTGGIKNAMERHEPSERIRQSLINAGYSPQEVEQAFQETNSSFSQPAPEIPQFQQLPPPAPESKSNLKIYIILAIVGVLIIIGAAMLGLYWKTITGWFK
jgi:hypothetical protein